MTVKSANHDLIYNGWDQFCEEKHYVHHPAALELKWMYEHKNVQTEGTPGLVWEPKPLKTKT